MRRADRATSRVKLLTALVGLATALVGLAGTVATQLGAFGDLRIPGLPGTSVAETELTSCDLRATPELSLSTGSGPSGTDLTVTGSAFCPGEQVEIRLHTERIQTARADDDGRFTVPARVPGTFDAFAPLQVDLVVSGEESLTSARVPFHLTARP